MAVPEVRLGRRLPGSLAPAVFAIVERGCLKRPELAEGLRCRAEVRLTEGHPAVRVTFAEAAILVEDAPPTEPADIDVPTIDDDDLDIGGGPGSGGGPGLDASAGAGEREARFEPDLIVEGSLTDIIAIMATPTFGGLPKLTHPHGRSTIVTIMAGRVRFRGNLFRARGLVRLLRI
jgi:hypothetical protein